MKKILLFFLFSILGCAQKVEPKINYLNDEKIISRSARVNRIEHEPRAGENFGLPRDQAVREIDPQTRKFLDGVLEIYRQPVLIGNRRVVLKMLGMKMTERTYFPTEGRLRPGFREDLSPHGDLASSGWSGYLYYRSADRQKDAWEMRIDLRIRQEDKACINSRAVEGYMDEVYWRPSFSLTAHQPFWSPEYWDRHGVFGGIWALPLNSTGPGLRLSFVEGCLVQIGITGRFSLGEMSDDEFYN
ncbi:hypothetical protein J2W23_003799 [Variovorax boronicumulans]|uniref:hypothetical protein n=1 Tax=Variovorax boronicumulans TaxID=436515 RepID=UPI002788E9F2|nr:hypothetical protein [Variovorax boronicumulans]MDQ0015399.1 hypothetical protein [Variovorax boronicumulans]